MKRTCFNLPAPLKHFMDSDVKDHETITVKLRNEALRKSQITFAMELLCDLENDRRDSRSLDFSVKKSSFC